MTVATASQSLKVVSAGRSHVGKVRSTNQDYYGLYEPSDPAELAAKGRLYVVCDGMGGAAGGEIASKLGTETILGQYRQAPPGDLGKALGDAITAANKAVYARSLENSGELMGMGSTAVALVIQNGTLHVGHDGDSRCYMLRNDEIVQLTKDHSMVQQMLDAGLIEESEVADHPRKNVIMRCLGVKPEIEVEVSSHPVCNGDIFFLCSDGLWGPVKKDDIRRIVLENKDNLDKAAEALLNLADQNGGPDNSTVVMVRVVSGGAPAPGGRSGGSASAEPAASPAAPAASTTFGQAPVSGAQSWDPQLVAKIVVAAGVVLLLLIFLIVILRH